MKNTLIKKYLPILLGVLTLILFATTPYILDLIEPHKSLGRIIGENTKDLLDTMNGKQIDNRPLSKRGIWSNLLFIFSFLLFGLSIITSISSLKEKPVRWIGITGVLLSLFSLYFFITYLAIGISVLIIIVFCVILLAFLINYFS